MKIWIRLSSVLLIAAGVLAALQSPECTLGSCPGYALTSPWILRAERGLAAVLIILIVLTILIRVVGEGELPDQIGREGFGWKRTTQVVNENVANLLKSVESLNDDFVALKSEVSELKKKVN